MSVARPLELRVEGRWLQVADPATGWSDRRELTADGVSELSRLAERYRSLSGGDDGSGLVLVGRDLYRWLDGEAGWLGRLRERVTPPFVLEVQGPRAPDAVGWAVLRAPWELLADERDFLAADPLLRYCPVRRLGAPAAGEKPDDHRLGVVFMAASPQGVVELDFEAEELAVLQAAGGLGLDLEVEDSGDPEQLGWRLTGLADWPVLHLSCHGHNAWRPQDRPEMAPQPALCLETAEGLERPTVAAELVTMLGASKPRLVFLSACLSAAAGDGGEKGEAAHSLATALVYAGLPAVLGWGGPVADVAATAFAHELYESLGRRLSLAEAAGAARRALLTGEAKLFGGSGQTKEDLPHPGKQLAASAEAARRDWHLARLWLGPAGGAAVVAGNKKRRMLGAHHGHKVLLKKKDPETQVAAPEMFVGRRRELQRCLRMLRGEDHAGVLLHGMGRLGKSSLAARLASRRPDLALAVVYKHYDAESVLQALLEALPACEAARQRLTAGLRQVREAREPEAKGVVLKEVLLRLLSGPCSQAGDGGQPVLLLVDDLERVLEVDPAGGRHRVEAAVRPVVEALLSAFNPNLSQSRLLLTSRFPFRLEVEGEDLAGRLHEEHLGSWGPVTQEKLGLRQARAAEKDLGGAALEARLGLLARVPGLSLGNAGLQDLLGEKLVLSPAVPVDRAAKVLDEMAAYLAPRKQAEEELADAPSNEEVRQFLSNLALGELLAQAGDGGRALLRSLLLFELPVPMAVAEVLAEGIGGKVAHLLDLGLLDPFEDLVAGEAVAVNRLAGARIAPPDAEERPALLEVALPVLFESWGGSEGRGRPYETNQELCRLGLEAGNAAVVAESAANAVGWLERSHQAQKAAEMGQKAIALLEVQEHLLPLDLLANTADALGVIGEGTAVEAVLAKGVLPTGKSATEVAPEALGRFLFARGEREYRAGRLDQALITFEALAAFQLEHKSEYYWATARGRIADILFVRGDLDEVLRIREEELLPVFTRLGAVLEIALTQGLIADIHYFRGDIDGALHIYTENVLPQIVDAGDISSFISIQARVANIQWAKGVFDEALKFYKDVLLPLSTLVGRERDTAVIYRNIADILEDQGKVDEALDLLRGKALPRAEKLGSLKDIAVFEGRIADLEEKRGNLNAALHIRRTKELKTYRYLRDTKSIAATKQKIGLALFSKGDFRGALKIYKESLVAYRRVGHQMGVAYSQCEIAAIEFKLKRVDRATARIEEAYCIFARIGRPADIARVGGVLGEFLLATGRREEARMMLTSSANANRTLGFLDEATEIEALIRQVGG